MINPDCPICFGVGWVCENRPKRAWSEELGCQCGARMPCEFWTGLVANPDLDTPVVRVGTVVRSTQERPGLPAGSGF